MRKLIWTTTCLVFALVALTLGLGLQNLQAAEPVGPTKPADTQTNVMPHIAAQNLEQWLAGKKVAFVEFYSPT